MLYGMKLLALVAVTVNAAEKKWHDLKIGNFQLPCNIECLAIEKSTYAKELQKNCNAFRNLFSKNWQECKPSISYMYTFDKNMKETTHPKTKNTGIRMKLDGISFEKPVRITPHVWHESETKSMTKSEKKDLLYIDSNWQRIRDYKYWTVTGNAMDKNNTNTPMWIFFRTKSWKTVDAVKDFFNVSERGMYKRIDLLDKIKQAAAKSGKRIYLHQVARKMKKELTQTLSLDTQQVKDRELRDRKLQNAEKKNLGKLHREIKPFYNDYTYLSQSNDKKQAKKRFHTPEPKGKEKSWYSKLFGSGKRTTVPLKGCKTEITKQPVKKESKGWFKGLFSWGS